MKNSPFEVRNSGIHGSGAFATRTIRKGTRIIEYVGERISTEESDARYDDHKPNSIVLLFVVDKNTVIDAGVGGNEARFINHSCDPNCEPIVDSKRIYIEAIRTIYPGDELTYDYNLTRDATDDDQTETAYICHCGAANCRGTMLEPLRKKRKPKKKKP